MRLLQSEACLVLVVVFALGLNACVAIQSASPPTAQIKTPDAWAFSSDRVNASHGRDGMVSSTDRVASEIGVEVLRRGGNAVDAAVAVHFALAVVNPEAGNIGGGGFMIVQLADGESLALDFREKAPLQAHPDMFLDAQGQLSDRSRIGHLAAGVPGSVAGMWVAHQRLGQRPWSELILPAIHLAEGLVVHERLASSLQAHQARLARYPSTRAIFLPQGQAPRVGDRLVQADLAATLQRIAEAGAEGFYQGQTAALIEAEMQRGGGIITQQDLARYTAVWRGPVKFQYRDHTVVAMPPPSSGGVTLATLLNMLERDPLAELGWHSAAHIHLWAEAAKRAFVDRNTYLADPDFVSAPLSTLISDAYATQRRAQVSPQRATPSAQVLPGLGPLVAQAGQREGADTTHYSIIDQAGNAVSVTTTINSLYGSLVTVGGAGFLLNNEMDDFAAQPGIPNQFGLVQGAQNAIAPEKRMLSSMTPTVVLDAHGRVKLVTGSPGGPTIISSVAQVISNLVDFEQGLVSATAAPRLHHQHLPDVLYYEHAGVAAEVLAQLRAMGHELSERSGYQGDVQSILVLPDGSLVGVADPRRSGAALSVRQWRDVVQ